MPWRSGRFFRNVQVGCPRIYGRLAAVPLGRSLINRRCCLRFLGFVQFRTFDYPSPAPLSHRQRRPSLQDVPCRHGAGQDQHGFHVRWRTTLKARTGLIREIEPISRTASSRSALPGTYARYSVKIYFSSERNQSASTALARYEFGPDISREGAQARRLAKSVMEPAMREQFEIGAEELAIAAHLHVANLYAVGPFGS
jgi:hypothetical protein